MRLVLFASILLGTAYAATWTVPVDEPIKLVWKFACVGSLALYAALRARSLDGWLLVAVLLCSAMSDVLLETAGQLVGGLSFIVADLFAIALYARNARAKASWRAWLATLLVMIECAALAFALPADRDAAPGIAIFVLPLALMAAMAWHSRFPRPLVGLGAIMILGSDMLIFARMGPFEGVALINEAIWLVYFLGEVLVTIGVTGMLGGANGATRLRA